MRGLAITWRLVSFRLFGVLDETITAKRLLHPLDVALSQIVRGRRRP